MIINMFIRNLSNNSLEIHNNEKLWYPCLVIISTYDMLQRSGLYSIIQVNIIKIINK